MFARLELLGTGATDDPYRVDLPSFSTVSIDYANMSSVVSFGTRDAPPDMSDAGGAEWVSEGGMTILTGLGPDQLGAWHARLASRYPSQSPPFRPDFP